MASATVTMPELARRTDPQWVPSVSEQAVQAELLRHLLGRMSLLGQIGAAVALLMLLWLMWQQAWVAAAGLALMQFGGLALLHGIGRSIRSIGGEAAVAQGLLRRIEWIAVAEGIGWGLASWGLSWSELPLAVLQVMVLPVLLVCAPAPTPRALLGFVLGLWLPLLGSMLWPSGPQAALLATGATLYLGALTGYGLRLQRQVESSIRSQMENHLLLAELKKSYLLQQQQSSALAEAHLQLNSALSRSQRPALHDELTGVLNQQAFLERARIEQQQSRGSALATACLMLVDLGGKSGQGGPMEASVVRAAARVLRSGLRGHDVLARWSDTAFIALLPHTHQGDAEVVVQRLGQALQSAGQEAIRLDRAGVSFGLAEWHPDHALDHVLQRLVDAAGSSAGGNSPR